MNIAILALAHQLKAALVAIKWPLKMIIEGDYGKIAPAQKDIIEKILSKNDSFILLVSDLLNVEKSHEGGYTYRRTSESMESIIKSVVDFNKEEVLRKKITMAFARQGLAVPQVTVDREMVMLAVQNIVDNAIKYSPSHGEVHIFLTADNKNVRCKVQDCGIGVLQEDKDRVFLKFYRGANAVKMDSIGSGLGLYIAKNIIEDHGGKIWFESEIHKGSTFYFTLPLRP